MSRADPPLGVNLGGRHSQPAATRGYRVLAALTALAIAVREWGTSRASWRLRIGPAKSLRSNVLRSRARHRDIGGIASIADFPGPLGVRRVAVGVARPVGEPQAITVEFLNRGDAPPAWRGAAGASSPSTRRPRPVPRASPPPFRPRRSFREPGRVSDESKTARGGASTRTEARLARTMSRPSATSPEVQRGADRQYGGGDHGP